VRRGPTVHSGLLDPNKRSIANGITIHFKDGTKTSEVVVEYPIGHRRRRAEGIPVLESKFRSNLARRFPQKQARAILDLCANRERLKAPRCMSSSTCSSSDLAGR
jgi:2-methylcitrate dehydratase PrpD